MGREHNLHIANEYLARLARGDAPESLAGLFHEDVELDIAGDVGALPWIGRSRGRMAVAGFIHGLRQRLDSLKFDVTDVLANENKAVILGELASRIKANGQLIETSFALVLTIDSGKIIRYGFLEDSFAVSRAARAPQCANGQPCG